MADYSFYGGQPGFSFIIVKSYKCIQPPDVNDAYFTKLIREDLIKEDSSLSSTLNIDTQIPNDSITYRQKWLNNYCMTTCFEKGPAYTAVHYEEHVLINTFNKNDPDNGKIFRRGYDYTGNLAGAVYVGTIVGPGGLAPDLSLTTKEEVEKLKDITNQDTEHYIYRFGNGTYTAQDKNIVPGYDADNQTYNDNIEWHYCSIRDKNNEDTMVHIGFVIPYTVIDFIAESESPYYNRSDSSDQFKNLDLAERIDDKTHPYFEKWQIKIPKGIKGDTFKNFRVIPADNTIDSYTGQKDDVDNNRQILVYDYYHYDKDENGEPISLYLGDYNMIDSIDMADDGTFTIDYTHNDNQVFSKKIRWIQSVSLDPDIGKFIVEYNNDTAPYEADLRWVKDLTVSADGSITLDYTTGPDTVLSQKVKWVTSVTVDSQGTLTINYNDGTSDIQQNQIKWVDSINLSSTGLFTVVYNNGEPDYTTQLYWIEDIQVDNNGDLTITRNDGYQDYRPGYFKRIDDVYIQTADPSTPNDPTTGNQRLHIKYNTDAIPIAIGEPLNYIREMRLTEDYKLIVYYADPATRARIDNTEKFSYNNLNDWHNLGSVKDESGILVGLNITYSDMGLTPQTYTIQDAINYLNSDYPNGLQGVDLKGKIASIGLIDGEKHFYAFDYSKSQWYYLGGLSLTADSFTMVAKDDPSDPNLAILQSGLSPGGIWYVLED